MPGHPLAKRGAPHWPPYRPSDAPPGPMATASLTGHLQAIRGGLPLAKGEAPTGQKGRGGDAFARPSPRRATYAPHRAIEAFGREASPLPD